MTTKRPPGRPRKYETPEQMQEVIDAYFEKTSKPTLTGLALALGFTSRQAFLTYQEYGPEFSDTVKTARLRIEEHYEKLLQDPQTRPAGPIFALKNLGWRDEQKIEHGGQVAMPRIIFLGSREDAREEQEAGTSKGAQE